MKIEKITTTEYYIDMGNYGITILNEEEFNNLCQEIDRIRGNATYESLKSVDLTKMNPWKYDEKSWNITRKPTEPKVVPLEPDNSRVAPMEDTRSIAQSSASWEEWSCGNKHDY